MARPFSNALLGGTTYKRRSFALLGAFSGFWVNVVDGSTFHAILKPLL
jgi:hypothetical protein